MESKSHRLNYESRGVGNPVILTHGIGGSLRQWDYIVPELNNSGFSSYAVDLTGHGDSEKPIGDAHYHIENIFEKFAFWLRRLNLHEPVVLVGHSMGAYICILYAARHPASVKSLILVNPFYNPEQLLKPFRWILKHPNKGIQLINKLPDLAYHMVFGKRVNGKSKVTGNKEVRNQISLDFKRASAKILLTSNTTRNLILLAEDVKAPSLVIWGKKDLTLSPSSFPALADAIPSAKVRQISDSGHVPHLDKIDKFNQIVLEFIGSPTNSEDN